MYKTNYNRNNYRTISLVENVEKDTYIHSKI